MAIKPKGGGDPVWRGKEMLADAVNNMTAAATREMAEYVTKLNNTAVTRVTSVTAVTHCLACGQRLPAATKAAAKQKAYRERRKANA